MRLSEMLPSEDEQIKSRRVFLALWPDENVRQQLVNALRLMPQSALQGVVFRPENLHLTLHFIGRITQQSFDCVHRVASEIQLPAFDLNLNRYDFFERAGVFWIGPDIIPQALIQLHNDLGQALINCGYKAQSRQFTPHVTLMRKLKQPVNMPAKLSESVNWRINQFALLESIAGKGGVAYIPRALYPLA